MKIRARALALLTATTLGLSSLNAPAATAYELTVEGDICTITFTEADTLLFKETSQVFLDQAFILLAEIPGVSVEDLNLLVEYALKDGYFTVDSFADTPVAATALQVNEAAVAAGFKDNEIFTILSAVMGVALTITFGALFMPSEETGIEAEPQLHTKDEAREKLRSFEQDILEPFLEFFAGGSEPGSKIIALVKEALENGVAVINAPFAECVGEETPVNPDDPDPVDPDPANPGDGDGDGDENGNGGSGNGGNGNGNGGGGNGGSSFGSS